jgi:hypothetical protein
VYLEEKNRNCAFSVLINTYKNEFFKGKHLLMAKNKLKMHPPRVEHATS